MRRVLVFVLGLVVVLGAGWGVGRAVAPIDTAPAADGAHGHGRGGGHADHDAAEAALPGGLAVAQDGYRLDLERTTFRPGTRPVAFTVRDDEGHAVRDYDVEHDKRLHLIVVKRDGRGFQHVHPSLDGTTRQWTADVRFTPGAWRVFADFRPTGADALTLGADVAVPGAVRAPAPADVTRTAEVDGYTVTLAGDLAPGEHSMLDLRVSRNGEPVHDLQPYLGAYGHLVALRQGDLAYLHVHPDGEPGDGETEPGPGIRFGAEVPSTGRYLLYLDFQHDGVVRTAAFVLDAEASHEH